jgi:alpha-D-ribose 1-methylphosphonate 5-triphosphate synthase subunit PhnI
MGKETKDFNVKVINAKSVEEFNEALSSAWQTFCNKNDIQFNVDNKSFTGIPGGQMRGLYFSYILNLQDYSSLNEVRFLIAFEKQQEKVNKK